MTKKSRIYYFIFLRKVGGANWSIVKISIDKTIDYINQLKDYRTNTNFYMREKKLQKSKEKYMTEIILTIS